MRLVVDSNVLFSALIRPSRAQDLFFHKDLELLTPQFVHQELEKHRAFIFDKSGLTPTDFSQLVSRLFYRLTVVSDVLYESFQNQARAITPDQDDWPFFALALRENAAIWSNDKALKNQNHICVFSTHELLARLFPLETP